jgi:pilus assembly protein CpaE
MSRLDSCFPGWPLLAVVEGDVDSSGLFQVSRAGASQIVPFPFERVDFDAALDRLLLQFGLRESPCRMIAISGVIEGCGATSVSLNLAAELAAIGEVPVILTEMSFGIGRLASQLNLTTAVTTRDLLADTVEPSLGTVKASLVKVNEYLSVLAGQSRTLEPFSPPAGRLPRLFRMLRQMSSFVIVDMPYTFDPHYFETLMSADRILLVARQDVPSVQAAKLIKAALTERGISEVGLVLNHYDEDLPAFTTSAIGELLRIDPVISVASDISGHHASANEGRPLREVVPMSASVADLRSIAAGILEKAGIPTHLPHLGVWDRVRTFLSRMRN